MDEPHHTLFKISKGSKLADEHYIETGHHIKVSGKEEKTRQDGVRDLVKYYECSECDFRSMSGERIKIM